MVGGCQGQGLDPGTAVNCEQRLILGTAQQGLQERLQAQAIDHQHLGLAEVRHILRPPLESVGISSRRKQ